MAEKKRRRVEERFFAVKFGKSGKQRAKSEKQRHEWKQRTRTGWPASWTETERNGEGAKEGRKEGGQEWNGE